MNEGILQKYRKLKSRERLMLFVFIVVVGGLMYYTFIYKPIAKSIMTYKFQIERQRVRLREIEAKSPALLKQKEKIEKLKALGEKMLKDIRVIENRLPNKKSIPDLISKLTLLAKNLKLISIRQNLEEGDKYSRIFIELHFVGYYKDIVNYIRRVEGLTPFLVLEQMEILEPAKKSREPGIPVQLMVSSILGEYASAENLQMGATEGDMNIARDIFKSKSKPAPKVKRRDLKLQGITYDPKAPTAIINGNVVTIGSSVDDLVVKEILGDMVILSDGTQDILLNLEN